MTQFKSPQLTKGVLNQIRQIGQSRQAMLTLNPRAGITEYNGAVQTYNNRSLSPFFKKNRYKLLLSTDGGAGGDVDNGDLRKSLESLKNSTI